MADRFGGEPVKEPVATDRFGGVPAGVDKPKPTENKIASEDRAAFGVFPKQRAVPSKPETQERMRGFEKSAADVLGFSVPEDPEMSAEKIGVAGGIGAAAGLSGPSILKGLGTAVNFIPLPPAKVAGATLRGLGTALGAIPAAQRTAGGGAMFGALETAGQVGEQVGVPRIVSESALLGIPSASRTLGKALIGTTRPEITSLAKKAEDIGFVLEPAQLRRDKPLGTSGFMERAKAQNEKLATQLASGETGVKTENITPSFLRERIKKLGDEYKEIFDRKLNIDTDLAKKLSEMVKFEQSVNPASVGPVEKAANNIIARWKDENLTQQTKGIENRINRIMQQQQNPRGGVPVMTRLKKDWPTLRDGTSGNVPEWFAGAESMVKELSDKLGLKVTPKVWVSESRRPGLYGMATGDGNIIINTAMDAKGAVSTALHEFGHQAEFQLFLDSSSNVKKSVMNAFNEQKKGLTPGMTVEQFRPFTAAKYSEEQRKQVPSSKDVNKYYNSFEEWFAEQTSRWITTTKQPTNLVEKFFAGVSNIWKEIYQKVVGHVPIAKDVDQFFRTNWKGDLLAPINAEAPTAVSFAETPSIPSEQIVAKIDGKELQRLRSDMTRIARTAVDGNDRRIAGEFVNAIDSAIGRYDPKLLERLRTTNRQYAATSVLGEGIEKGWVSQGAVSLQGMGEHLANNIYGFGVGTAQHPLYDLGYMGRALRIRSRVEGSEFSKYDAVSALLGRSRQTLGSIVGTRSQAARSIQRKLSEE